MDCDGPLAWTVEDCALMLAGMVSSDALDLRQIKGGIKGLRVGVVRHFYEGDPEVDESVLIAMEQSLKMLEQLGARLSTVEIGNFEEILCDRAGDFLAGGMCRASCRARGRAENDSAQCRGRGWRMASRSALPITSGRYSDALR
jgi:Asp-tRNA(Asn)/Glu-tRNA(Gln) amidotransferase A subunit family amidase